jgi:aromatic-L-amino-acid decarboxylase
MGAPGDPLWLDPETMRDLGYRAVDAVVDILHEPSAPPVQRATAAEMDERVPSGAPEGPSSFDELLERLRVDVLPYRSRHEHPGFFAFVPGGGTFPGALGDFLASGLNVFTGTWLGSAGGSHLEQVVLRWFQEWIGYPPSAGGILLSGGSAANMTALACAREALLGAMTDTAVAYVSDQGHSSLARAARTLGFRADQVRVLPTDARFRMRADVLAAAVQADEGAGRQPLFVGATAGTTNTGAIDPLPELAAFCRARGLWLHVDGAYGGFAMLTDRGREALTGLAEADSVSLDAHKWFFQPYECGCLLVRDRRRLRDAFSIMPDYLSDATGGEVDFADLGLQLTRSWRALKVWLSVSYFGLAAFRRAIDNAMDLAAETQRRIEGTPELELLSPASLGIVAFRRRGEPGEDEATVAQRNAGLAAGLEAAGAGFVSSTRLRGRYAVRMCILNHSTSAEDVERVLDWFAHAPVPAAPPRAATPTSDRTAAEGWLGPPAVPPAELARLPVFAGIERDQLDALASWCRLHRVSAGAAVTRPWELTRDFFVILDGAAVVEVDGEHVRDLTAGDFFGEIAALDWGAGYGYARSATVVATRDSELLALGPAHFQALMRSAPAFSQRVKEAAAERLTRVSR